MVLVIQYKLEADMQPRSDKMGDEEQHPPRLWHAHLQSNTLAWKSHKTKQLSFPGIYIEDATIPCSQKPM